MANQFLLKKSSVGAKVPLVTDLVYGELALNYVDGKVYYKTGSNTIDQFASNTATATLTNKTLTSPVITGGSINNTPIGATTTNTGAFTTVTASGDISGGYLKSTNSQGDEGGEILLAKPATNSTISGTGVTIDIWQNRLRIFEQGGTARGVFIDLTAAAAGVATNLISAGSGTVTSIVAGTGLTGGTITSSGTIAIDSTVATLTGTQTLTNKTLTSPTLTAPVLGTPASGNFSTGTFTWPTFNQNTTGTATTATTANALNTANSYTGVNFTATGSLTIGTGGTYVAGSIYSDASWGMIFRAKQPSPTQAEYRWATSADTELARLSTAGNLTITGTVAGTNITTGGNVTGTAAGLSATLVATSGGTGQSTYAIGDLLQGGTTNTLTKLSAVATGNALISGGVTTASSWGKIGLTTHVSGTLPVANGGTGVTTSTGTGNTVLSASPTFTGTIGAANLTLSGDLTVNGTTTTINSTTISVDDKNIELGSVASPTDITADGGGITLKGTTDKTINWSSVGWTSSEDFNLASGKVYEINGTTVLSGTTLGSGVTGSSLTSVGTIATGVWQGTVVAGQYGGTGVANTGKTITIGGNFTHTGAHTLGLTTTAATSVTLPTTGTLATLAGTEILSNKSFTGETRFYTTTYTDPDSGVARAVKISNSGLAVLGGIKTDTLTNTALTSGRVTFASTAGLLADSANLLFNGTALGIGGAPSTALDVTATGGMMRINGASGNNLIQAQTGSIGLGLWAGGNSRLYSTGALTLSVNSTLTTSIPTGYVDAVTILSTGNVGIGIASPTAKLHVIGTTQLNHQWSAAANGFIWGQFNVAGDASINNTANAPLLFGTNNLERMRLDASGNLGIGLTSAGERLSVSGTARIAAGSGTASSLVLTGGASNFIFQHTVSSGVAQIYNTGGNLAWGAGGTTVQMTLASSGNLGVGTASPGYKLEVNGSFAATTKSFVIDHPTKPNMKLRYGSLEGPENGVYIRGKLTGNTIELPDYWLGLVHEDSITVSLTPIGQHQKLYVKDIVNNTILVGNENLLGKTNCFYTVFAERKDVDKLEVEI